MHVQVADWVAAQAAGVQPRAVLEIGSLDINGSVRPFFAGADHYHGLDLASGPGVDEVADAATWQPPRTYDVVVCAEVLEHAPRWHDVLTTMWGATAPGGLVLMTCATAPRAPHSAVDGMDVRPEEHYENVRATDVIAVVRSWTDAGPWSIEWAAGRGDLYLRVAKACSESSSNQGPT